MVLVAALPHLNLDSILTPLCSNIYRFGVLILPFLRVYWDFPAQPCDAQPLDMEGMSSLHTNINRKTKHLNSFKPNDFTKLQGTGNANFYFANAMAYACFQVGLSLLEKCNLYTISQSLQ